MESGEKFLLRGTVIVDCVVKIVVGLGVVVVMSLQVSLLMTWFLMTSRLLKLVAAT